MTEQGNSVAIQVAQVKDQLNKCHIQSPIEGTVLAKYAEAGELAAVGKPLFKVAEIGRMYLRAYITSEQLSQVKLGAEGLYGCNYVDFRTVGIYTQNHSDEERTCQSGVCGKDCRGK